jgi:hypothetical protein
MRTENGRFDLNPEAHRPSAFSNEARGNDTGRPTGRHRSLSEEFSASDISEASFEDIEEEEAKDGAKNEAKEESGSGGSQDVIRKVQVVRPRSAHSWTNIILFILLICVSYGYYDAVSEKVLWMDANGITRGVIHDLYSHRGYGRGIVPHIVSERFARGWDGLVDDACELFGVNYETYPMPG